MTKASRNAVPVPRARGWGVALGLLLAFAAAAALAAPATPGAALATLQAPSDVALEEIVSGRARLGFTPVVADGVHVVGGSGESTWLRLRTDVPTSEGRFYLGLPRQAIHSMRLYLGAAPFEEVAHTGIAETDSAVRWPDLMTLPLPADAHGPVTLYVEVRGNGHLNLRPRLLDAGQWQGRAASSSRAYDLLYTGLLTIVLLAVARRGLWGRRTLRVAAAAFGCLVAALVGNYHLQLSLGGTSLAAIPVLPVALWVMACGPLLWATGQFAGMQKHHPDVDRLVDRSGLALVAVGLLLLFLPLGWLPHLQVLGLLLVAATSLACAGVLLAEPNRWRWVPAMVWLAMAPALLAIALGTAQVLPATRLVMRGFQLLLSLQLAIYLGLPWLREWRADRQRRRRGDVVEQSAEEKIAHAREWMIRSLQAGIENASDDGDMEWIAYRRLMGGLKPVLPQEAAAVIAMNYHSEDLLLVEPRSAEPRFQMLLAQRGSLLKNLSRSLAPHQIGVDFTGPEGPLHQVLLAVIPLPIERPGWGALVIERAAGVSYSEAELDLGAEFAALATTAGDEAATVMLQRRAAEIEPESGVYRSTMAESLVRRAHDSALAKRKPLSVLRVGIDGFADLASQEARATVARLVADLVRDEIDYGETILRMHEDQFLVLLPARPIGDARTLGERLCVAVRKLALPVAEAADAGEGAVLGLSVGASQMLIGERTPQQALDRAGRALAKARQYGGNQVQAVAGALG